VFNWSSRKLEKRKRSYFKERLHQRQHLSEEFSRLCKLLKENSIDESTFQRLKALLEMGYKQKRQETRIKYGFT
jgi:hypothetical protein